MLRYVDAPEDRLIPPSLQLVRCELSCCDGLAASNDLPHAGILACAADKFTRATFCRQSALLQNVTLDGGLSKLVAMRADATTALRPRILIAPHVGKRFDQGDRPG